MTESRQSRQSYSRPPSSLGRAGSALGSYAPSASTYALGAKTPRSAARFGGLQEKELQKVWGAHEGGDRGSRRGSAADLFTTGLGLVLGLDYVEHPGGQEPNAGHQTQQRKDFTSSGRG